MQLPHLPRRVVPNKSNLPYAVIFSFGTFHDFDVLQYDFCVLRVGSVAAGMCHCQPRQAALFWARLHSFPGSCGI